MKWMRYIPNILTILRILLIIPITVLIFGNYIEKLISLLLLIIAGITDFLDGYLARKYKVVSEFGNFFDPLADKLIIIAILISFLQLDPTIFPYWMVWLIVSREFVLTALRIGGIQEKEKVKTLFIGKIKTTAQFITIFFIILLLIIKDYLIEKQIIKQVKGLIGLSFNQIWFNYFGDWAYFITYTPSFLLGISTFLSLYSGIHYLIKHKNKLFFYEEEQKEGIDHE